MERCRERDCYHQSRKLSVSAETDPLLILIPGEDDDFKLESFIESVIELPVERGEDEW